MTRELLSTKLRSATGRLGEGTAWIRIKRSILEMALINVRVMSGNVGWPIERDDSTRTLDLSPFVTANRTPADAVGAECPEWR